MSKIPTNAGPANEGSRAAANHQGVSGIAHPAVAHLQKMEEDPLPEVVQRKIIFIGGGIGGKRRFSMDKLLEVIMKNGQGSLALRDLLIFLNESSTCHLRITLHGAVEGVKAHGTTGIFVLGQKKGPETFISETIMLDPWQLLLTPGFVIAVEIYSAENQDPVEAAMTILHELELHAVHAGNILRKVNDTPDLNEKIKIVMALKDRPDDHADFNRLAQYIQSAVGIRNLLKATPWASWARELVRQVADDAVQQFTGAVSRGTHGGQAELDQLQQLIAMEKAAMAEAAVPAPTMAAPAAAAAAASGPGHHAAGQGAGRVQKAPWAAKSTEVTKHVQQLVMQRMPWEKIVTLMDEQFGVSRELTTEVYRTSVIPWLLRQAPKELKKVEQLLRFVVDHGVPEPIAFDVVERANKNPVVKDIPMLDYAKAVAPRERRIIKVGSVNFTIDPDEVPGDGDCLFNSLIRLGVNQGRNVAQLRQLARDQGARAAVTTPREWADENDMTAVANGLGIRIVLVRCDLGYKPDPPRILGAGGNQVFIAHIMGGHCTPMHR